MFIETCMFADDYGNIKLLCFWREFAREKRTPSVPVNGCTELTVRRSARCAPDSGPGTRCRAGWSWTPAGVSASCLVSDPEETEENPQKFPRCRVQRSGFTGRRDTADSSSLTGCKPADNSTARLGANFCTFIVTSTQSSRFLFLPPANTTLVLPAHFCQNKSVFITTLQLYCRSVLQSQITCKRI